MLESQRKVDTKNLNQEKNIFIKTCSTCGVEYKSESDFLKGTSRWRICSRRNLWFNCRCGSTLLIKKDHFDWYAPEKVMNERNASIFSILNQKESLPYIKSSTMELQELLNAEDVDLKKVYKILKTDPILTGEILKTASRIKSAYGDGSEIENIKHALVYLGNKRVSNIVMSISLKHIQLKTTVFDLDDFWKNSFHQALVTEFLAKKYAPYLNSDEMYLIGFLLNIGKLVSAYYFPQKVDKIVSTLKNPKNTHNWVNLEKICQLESYLVLGEIACSFWGFPEYILDCCTAHLRLSTSKQKMFSKSDFAVFGHIMTNWVQYDLNNIDYLSLDLISQRLEFNKIETEEIAKEATEYVTRANF